MIPRHRKLRPKPEGLIAEARLTADLDSQVSEFGNEFWKLLSNKAKALGTDLTSGAPLETITYRDRYLRSPWSIIILREVVCSLVSIEGLVNTSTNLKIATFPLESRDARRPFNLEHDWPGGSESERKAFVEHAFDRIPDGLNWPGPLKFSTERSETPHFRELTLRWRGGKAWSINLDQGFGFWRPLASRGFPFGQPTTNQVKTVNVLRSQLRVAARDQRHPTLVYVKEAQRPEETGKEE